jgi:hypothetical protein
MRLKIAPLRANIHFVMLLPEKIKCGALKPLQSLLPGFGLYQGHLSQNALALLPGFIDVCDNKFESLLFNYFRSRQFISIGISQGYF